MTESEILAEIDAYLEATGWIVRKFSFHRGTGRQFAGWPDRVAFRFGVTLLIEAKSKTGLARIEQKLFAKTIESHLGPTLRYILARSVEDVEAVSGGR